MIYWECRRRLTALRQFRNLAVDYFENIQAAGWASGGAPPRMNDKAQKARHEINHMIDDIVLSLNLLNIPHVIAYQPVRAGEYPQPVDVVANIFALYQFQISTDVVLDSLDRAIGSYERRCSSLWRRSFNPLYWLGLLVVWIVGLPFKLIGAAGFNATEFEASLVGKALKLTWTIVVGLAALIPAILETSDHWSQIREFAQRFLGRI